MASGLLQIVTALLGIVGSTLVVPVITAIACSEYSVIPSFLIPMAASGILYILVNLVFFRKKKINLSIRSTFVIVASAWFFTKNTV